MSDVVAAPAAPAASSPAPSTPAPSNASPALAQSATPATPQGTPPTDAAPAAPKMYRQRVNGQDREIPAEAIDKAAEALGLSPEEFLQASQLKAAAYQRFEAAEKLRREAEAKALQVSKRLEDPRVKALAAERGMSPEDAAAIIHVQDLIAREQMSPEQRALQEERQRREALEKQIKDQEQTAAQAKRDEETRAHAQRFHQEIPAAMEAAGLPNTPEAARLVIEYAARAAKLGLPVDLKWAAADAAKQLTAKYAPVFSRMAPEKLIAALGKDAIDALQKHLIARAQAPAPQPVVPKPNGVQPQKKSYGLTVDEWRAKFAG